MSQERKQLWLCQSRAGSWLLPGSPRSLLLKPRQQAQGKLPRLVQGGGQPTPKAAEKRSKRNQALQKPMQGGGEDNQRDNKCWQLENPGETLPFSWAKLPQQDWTCKTAGVQSTQGMQYAVERLQGGRHWIVWARTLGLGVQEGPWESEFITVAFEESNKIQKVKPEERRLEAMKCLQKSKQGNRWGQAGVDEMEQQTGEEGRGGQKTKMHAGVYSSLSLEGNIISLCLLCQQIPKGKRPLLIQTATEQSLPLPPASLLAQAADITRWMQRFQSSCSRPHGSHCKISDYSLHLIWKARKLRIQKRCQKYFKRLQTDATKYKEIPALGSSHTQELPRRS